jgi:hypothetical protein
MDDKSLNLWRQIEGCRREKKPAERRLKPVPLLVIVAESEVAA